MTYKNAKTKKSRKGWLWFCSIFFLIAALSFFPQIASLPFLVVGLATLPVTKWQDFLKSKIPEKILKFKTFFIIAIAVLGIAITPAAETNSSVNDETSANVQTVEENVTKATEAIESTKNISSPVPTQTPTPSPAPTKSPEPTQTPSPEPSKEQVIIPTPEVTPALTENSYFEVHFIDVGQADAALVCCDGQYLLIDGGNVEDSSLMYSYLKNLNVEHLNYVVATHAHEDHIGGLSGALNYASAGTVYCPVLDYDTDAFGDFKKYVEKNSITLTVPQAGDTFSIGAAECEIVGVNGGSDVNDTSIILRVCYGDTSFLFTGDAEREAEQAVLNAGYDISSTVLKVGHHGSANSTTYPFLREIMPQAAIISVGEDNTYGHPTEEALSRLRDADVKVYRTDLQGDIIVKSDGKTISVEVEKNSDADTLAVQAPPTPAPTPVPKPQPTEVPDQPASGGTESDGSYAVNGNNGKIHIVGACPATGTGKNAMKKPVYFDTYEQAEQHSIAIAPSEDKRRCGNCW